MKEKRDTRFSLGMNFFSFSISTYLASETKEREGLQLYNSLVKVTRGLKRWIRERMELRKYLVLIFFERIFLEACPGVESASNKYATKR